MPNFLSNSEQCSTFYDELRQRERQWWQARQRMVVLKEKQMFWYGENSVMMWFVWQLVSYFLVAIIMMLLNKGYDIHLQLWQYLAVFMVQTIVFLSALVLKEPLAKRLQARLYKADLAREQTLNEMVILAKDSIYPDIHSASPLSLQDIYERYQAQLRLASLHRLLQKEVEAGRLIIKQNKPEAHILPLALELADDELRAHASQIIYKSVG